MYQRVVVLFGDAQVVDEMSSSSSSRRQRGRLLLLLFVVVTTHGARTVRAVAAAGLADVTGRRRRRRPVSFHPSPRVAIVRPLINRYQATDVRLSHVPDSSSSKSSRTVNDTHTADLRTLFAPLRLSLSPCRVLCPGPLPVVVTVFPFHF